MWGASQRIPDATACVPARPHVCARRTACACICGPLMGTAGLPPGCVNQHSRCLHPPIGAHHPAVCALLLLPLTLRWCRPQAAPGDAAPLNAHPRLKTHAGLHPPICPRPYAHSSYLATLMGSLLGPGFASGTWPLSSCHGVITSLKNHWRTPSRMRTPPHCAVSPAGCS